MKKDRKRNILAGLYVFGLAVASACVVVDGAAAEPYLTFRLWDAFFQVGIAVALMVLWLQFAGWLIYGVITDRMAKPWLALTIVVCVALFYLWLSPVGYVGDITKFVIEKQ